MNSLFLSFLLLLTITTTTATPTDGIIYDPPKIGVTFDPTTPNIPPLDFVVTTLVDHNIRTVRLINPTPYSIHAFSNTNINLLISIPNTFLYAFAKNQFSSATWITHNILHFHNTTRISLISIDSKTPITRFHLPALRNLYTNLRNLGILNVPVSVTFHLETILFVNDWLQFKFNISEAEFYSPELIRPLVRFLKSTNSSFLVTIYPYKIHGSGEPALLLPYTRDGHRTNLFNDMVDSVVLALESVGEGNVPVIVAETGWPCKTLDAVEDENQWASSYLNRLMLELLYYSGTKRVDEVYVYELFGDEWGILDQEMKLKQEKLQFFGFEAAEKDDYSWLRFTAFYGLWLMVWYAGLFYMFRSRKKTN